MPEQNKIKVKLMLFLLPLVGGIASFVGGTAATATAAAATVGGLSVGTLGTIAAGSVAAGALMSAGAKRRAAEAEARSARAEATVRELQAQVDQLQQACSGDEAESEDLARLVELQEEIDAISNRMKHRS